MQIYQNSLIANLQTFYYTDVPILMEIKIDYY